MVEALKDEPEISLTLACNEEMDAFQSKDISDFRCLTDRQNMLSMAANYYLNHKLGFDCNTIWLASFLAPQFFGCAQGWVHKDGALCHGRHFGFKDSINLPHLIFSSTDYISELLDKTLDEVQKTGKSDSADTADLYIQTILFCIDDLLKRYFQGGDSDRTRTQISELLIFVEKYDALFDDYQMLYYMTLESNFAHDGEFQVANFDAMKKIMMNPSPEGPSVFSYVWLHDAWNFLVLGIQAGEKINLGGLFIGTRYREDCLNEFSDHAIRILNSKRTSSEIKEMLQGFFTNYI